MYEPDKPNAIISAHSVVSAVLTCQFPRNSVDFICIFFRIKFVSDAPDIHDIARCVRGNPELSPQMAHEAVDSFVRSIDVFLAPHLIGDGFKGQHSGAAHDQELEGIKLFGGQVNLLAPDSDQPLLRAKMKLTNLDGVHGSRGTWLHGGGGDRTR